jgi:hypothetical protein
MTQRQIGDEITEGVDVDDFSAERRLLPMRLSNLEDMGILYNLPVRREPLILGEPCRCRSKDVTALERVAFRMESILFVADLADLERSFLIQHMCEQSVIRRQKIISGTFHNKRASVAPYTRIDYSHMHRSVGKVLVTGLPHVGAVFNGMRGNPMTEVDDRRLRIDGEDNPLHARHEPIPIAEIGQERDEPGGVRHASSLSKNS